MTDGPDISRRELLRGRFLRRAVGALVAPLTDPVPARPAPRTVTATVPPASSARRGAFPVLRPPGAVDEPTFLAECTRCAECITACPHDAITTAPVRFRQAAGTPMIDPVAAPCRMCDPAPCVDACVPDVLSALLPRTMGEARILGHACLALTGSFCTVCSEHCPVEGAIEVTAGRPAIVADRCTGCGVCQHVCPAPQNAVLLMPLRERPPRPETGDA